MADTLMMVDPNRPGSMYKIPRDKLGAMQAKGLMLGEEWQNKEGESHYYPLSGRGDALRAGLSRPVGSKAHSEEELSETIPPMDTSTDPPPDLTMMDKVRQGVGGALGDPGPINVVNAVAGAAPGEVMNLARQGMESGVGKVSDALSKTKQAAIRTPAQSAAASRPSPGPPSSYTSPSVGWLKRLSKNELVRKIVKKSLKAAATGAGGGGTYWGLNEMNKTQ